MPFRRFVDHVEEDEVGLDSLGDGRGRGEREREREREI